MKNKKILLWLDDYRNPLSKDIDWLVFSPIGRDCEIHWVKDYYQFTNWITRIGLPTGICFDHDLGENESGYDAAKWLIEYCQFNNKELPLWSCQSANPVGKDNINSILNNYKKII